jgi:type IV pilus assembly protein PilA
VGLHAIIGVLAAIAVYGVARYLKQAKTAEATRALGSIENGERQQFQRETPWPPGSTSSDRFEHTFCPAAALTPATVPLGHKVMVPATSWNTAGWTCAKFVMTDPQYYAYQLTGDGAVGTAAVYTASAHGDLDGNGVTSIFELVGHGGSMGDAVRDNFRVIRSTE